MSKEVPWNKYIYDEFCEIAMLSELESKILKTRIMGLTIKEQSQLFDRSESSISEIISTLKKKYDLVQRYSQILPPRKTSKQETYMDTH